MISALKARLTGIPDGYALELFVVGICVALFSLSVWLGLTRGIRRLSDVNLLMAFLFLLFVLFAGDTLFILNMAVNSVGHLLQNTLAMTFWTDPVANSGFVGDWTVFYWAWWIAYAPFIGIFVTRISAAPCARWCLTQFGLGVWLFFFVLGNHLWGYSEREVDVIGVMNAESGTAAIVAGLDALPWLPSRLDCSVWSPSSLSLRPTTARLHRRQPPDRTRRISRPRALALVFW